MIIVYLLNYLQVRTTIVRQLNLESKSLGIMYGQGNVSSGRAWFQQISYKIYKCRLEAMECKLRSNLLHMCFSRTANLMQHFAAEHELQFPDIETESRMQREARKMGINLIIIGSSNQKSIQRTVPKGCRH
jgi:hypothetical protein